MSKALPDRGLAAFQAELAADRDRLQLVGQDPLDDHLEQQAAEPAPRRRKPWTVCECGAWEKGYKHPGHRHRCHRYSSRDER